MIAFAISALAASRAIMAARSESTSPIFQYRWCPAVSVRTIQSPREMSTLAIGQAAQRLAAGINERVNFT